MSACSRANLLRLMIVSACRATGCAFSVAPTSSEDSQLTLELSAFPDRLPAGTDTLTAEIWATVTQGGKAVRDSTGVAFATTLGTITDVSLTTDGLAVAFLTGPPDLAGERQAEIVAQAVTIRDTLIFRFVDE
jgi:hypothetical protein